MEIEGYEERKCWACDGAGTVVDMTMSDKVCVGGNLSSTCSTCRGAGVTRHARFVALVAAGYVPSGAPTTEDIPDWMC